MKNTFLKISILLFFILALGCDESGEEEVKNLTISSINQFFYEFKAIEYDLNKKTSGPKQRESESKLFKIKMNQLSLELDEDWEFLYQNFEIANVHPIRPFFR